MDKTTDTAQSPAHNRKIWVKPEVVDVDGSSAAIEAGPGAVTDGSADNTS